MKFWMVINVIERSDVAEFLCDEQIPKSSAPTYMHAVRENAEIELLRLSVKFPAGEFYLLEAVASVSRAMNEDQQVFRVESN